MNKNNCLVCKSEIPLDHPVLITNEGHICMSCEGTELNVYRFSLASDLNSSAYYDIDLLNIQSMLEDCEPGEGFTIIKHKMRVEEYYSLPEFQGF